MARKGKARKMGRYIKGNIDVDMPLGTLAAQTLLAQKIADDVTESTFISSIKAIWSLANFTQLADVGPIMVGVAHSDYSAAEIEAWVERATSWDVGDKVSQELSNRFIRKVGVLVSAPDPVVGLGSVSLNDGKPIRTKLGWVLASDQSLDIWAYNMGTVDISATNPNLHVTGHANLWPR